MFNGKLPLLPGHKFSVIAIKGYADRYVDAEIIAVDMHFGMVTFQGCNLVEKGKKQIKIAHISGLIFTNDANGKPKEQQSSVRDLNNIKNLPNKMDIDSILDDYNSGVISSEEMEKKLKEIKDA